MGTRMTWVAAGAAVVTSLPAGAGRWRSRLESEAGGSALGAGAIGGSGRRAESLGSDRPRDRHTYNP